LFESLKKKFTGTIGKISDKVSEEEELEASSGTTEITKTEKEESSAPVKEIDNNKLEVESKI
jgi:fused signal recognition particle receptor